MFYLPYLTLVVLILKIGNLSEAASDYIVGGRNAVINTYPHQVSIHINSKFRCGGSVLAPKVILTAAHCSRSAKGPDDITVRAGSNFTDQGGQLQQVALIHTHPKHRNDVVSDYDAAIYILKHPFILNANLSPIPLSSTIVPEGAVATATGWGTLRYQGPKSHLLQEVDVPKLNDDLCATFYPEYVMTPRMTCYGYPEGKKDACQGDSGGPLTSGHALVGIVSWGYGCADAKRPGVYTNIFDDEIREFIKSYI